jgi:hypothetical protein
VTLSVEAAHAGVVVAGNDIDGVGLRSTGCGYRCSTHGSRRSLFDYHSFHQPVALGDHLHRSGHDDYDDNDYDDNGAGTTPA